MRNLTVIVLLTPVVLCSCSASTPSLPQPVLASEQAHQHQSTPPLMIRDKLTRLTDPDPNERAWAAYQLGKFGGAGKAAIPALIDLLQDDTPVLLSRYLGGGYHSSNATTPGEEACQTLAKIGRDAVPALLQAVHADKAVVRQLAAKALGQIGELNSIKVLLPMLDDPDRQVRASAALALGSYRHPQASQMILDALPGATASSRAGMVYALGQINDVLAVPALIQRFPQEQVDVRAAIMYALGRLRDGEAIATLLQGLHDADEIVRANAANALGNYYNQLTMGALIDALNDPSDRVRDAALETLEQVSGMQLGRDTAQWRQWWQQQQLNIPQPSRQPP